MYQCRNIDTFAQARAADQRYYRIDDAASGGIGLRDTRQSAGLTQLGIADRIGIDRNYISQRWRTGGNRTAPSAVSGIASAWFQNYAAERIVVSTEPLVVWYGGEPLVAQTERNRNGRLSLTYLNTAFERYQGGGFLFLNCFALRLCGGG